MAARAHSEVGYIDKETMKWIAIRKLTPEEEIRFTMENYRRTLNSTGFAFYADTYGHEKMCLREAQRALCAIERILEQ